MKDLIKHYFVFVVVLITELFLLIATIQAVLTSPAYVSGVEVHYYMTDERLATLNEIRISDYKSLMKH